MSTVMSESIINESSTNIGHEANDHLTILNQENSSYSFIEYFLRLSMQASTARIMSSWEVSNPQLTLQFEKRAKVPTISKSL